MTESRLIAEVFIFRGDSILILKRASGRAEGWWSPPGGMVEPGEDPMVASVREVLEETGLRIEQPEIVRRWHWQLAADSYVREVTTLTAKAPAGNIILSGEHTDSDWISLAEYVERFCSPRSARLAPDYAGLFAEFRKNCLLIERRMHVPLS